MKSKKLLLPKIIILTGMALCVLVNLILCIAKKPAVTRQTFPFSITYEIGGETVTIRDEFTCTYTGAGQSVDPSDRFYDGVLARQDQDLACGDYLIRSYDNGELIVLTRFFAGYMMGDPLYADHYTEYYRFEPQIAFYVYDDYMEYTDEETLAPYDVRIVDWDYPEPIENSFVFSGITRPTRRTVLPMAAVSLLTLLVCLIFVKKDRSLPFGPLDKFSVALNVAIGLIVFPFLSVVCTLVDINGNADDPISVAMFFVPALTGFSLAASVCLRRKGFGKAAFAVQFLGMGVMALLLLAESFLT